MKIRVKFLSLFLAVLLLAGCGKADTIPADSNAETSAASQSAEETVSESAEQQKLPLPKEGISPITGLTVQYPGQRPVAVMLYNNMACRPQWGIGAADLLIEANIEGQESRLMAVYEGVDAVEKVGPVGPARDAFLQMVMPFGVIPMFNGSDVYSSNLLNQYKYQPIDGHYAGVSAFDYDSSRRGIYPAQYNWYAHKGLIPGALELYGQSAEGETPAFFEFSEETAPTNTDGTAIEVGYGTGRTVLMQYDAGQYVMKEAGDFQWDANQPDTAVGFDNVLLLLAKHGTKDDGVTREYDLTEGQALYLYQGSARQIQWKKNGVMSPLQLFDENGNPFQMHPGRIYLGIWNGFEGQTLKLYNAEWVEQPLPELPGAIQTGEPAPASEEPVPVAE